MDVLIECKLDMYLFFLPFNFKAEKKENQIRDQKEHLFERKVTLQLVNAHSRVVPIKHVRKSILITLHRRI